jgi:hypothetical protein
VDVFTFVSESGATSSTHFFEVKLQNFAPMVYNVANGNLKIDTQNEKGTPFFKGGGGLK